MLPECDVPRIRINRETTLQRRRHLSSPVSMSSCFALRVVTVWEPWGLPAVCGPSCTVDARNVRKVWFSVSSHASSLMPSLGYTCVLDNKKWLVHAEIVFESTFVGDVCPGAAFSRASSSGFLLCERHRQRLRQRSVEWLSPLALGTHFSSPTVDGKPHLRFTCFSPCHVEKAATPFSRPRKFVHMGATAYIDEHNRLWTRPYLFGDHYENPTTVFHVLVHGSCLSSSAYSRTHLQRYSQANVPTISCGIRTKLSEGM